MKSRCYLQQSWEPGNCLWKPDGLQRLLRQGDSNLDVRRRHNRNSSRVDLPFHGQNADAPRSIGPGTDNDKKSGGPVRPDW
jgi:hypothetical protein